MFGQGSGALNSLLVVMDGLGGPPFWRRFWVNRLNTWMDASYIVPQKIGSMPLRLRRPKPANEQIYFIGACNAPIESLDPALTRPGRMGRHVWFRTPTKDDRQDIFDLYLGKVAHENELDEARRRDELARITNGYSPAMIEQVCSMALTVAHHEGRPEFGWFDLVEAMTTIESGTAVNVEYVPEETRAVAIHEAGHAVTSHVYAERLEATRLTIRMRGSALGHYYALEKEERFSSWRHEQVALLIQTLGAMAAEHVFYGENSVGVGGDVQMVTTRAALMVGAFSMAPEQPNFDGLITDDERAEQAQERVMKRYEKIGNRIMQRASGGTPFTADPISRVLGDPGKRRMVAELLGQAYIAAYATIIENRAAVEKIADVLVERKEIYGDEVLSLLDECKLQKPSFDELDEASWPKV
jgi:ATP-dependent Zn protease